MRFLYQEHTLGNPVEKIILLETNVVIYYGHYIKIYDLEFHFIREKFFYEPIKDICNNMNMLIILFGDKLVQCDLEFNTICLRALMNEYQKVISYKDICLVYNRVGFKTFKNMNNNIYMNVNNNNMYMNIPMDIVKFIPSFIPTILNIKRNKAVILSIDKISIIEEFSLKDSCIEAICTEELIILFYKIFIEIRYKGQLYTIYLNKEMFEGCNNLCKDDLNKNNNLYNDLSKDDLYNGFCKDDLCNDLNKNKNLCNDLNNNLNNNLYNNNASLFYYPELKFYKTEIIKKLGDHTKKEDFEYKKVLWKNIGLVLNNCKAFIHNKKVYFLNENKIYQIEIIKDSIKIESAYLIECEILYDKHTKYDNHTKSVLNHTKYESDHNKSVLNLNKYESDHISSNHNKSLNNHISSNYIRNVSVFNNFIAIASNNTIIFEILEKYSKKIDKEDSNSDIKSITQIFVKKAELFGFGKINSVIFKPNNDRIYATDNSIIIASENLRLEILQKVDLNENFNKKKFDQKKFDQKNFNQKKFTINGVKYCTINGVKYSTETLEKIEDMNNINDTNDNINDTNVNINDTNVNNKLYFYKFLSEGFPSKIDLSEIDILKNDILKINNFNIIHKFVNASNYFIIQFKNQLYVYFSKNMILEKQFIPVTIIFDNINDDINDTIDDTIDNAIDDTLHNAIDNTLHTSHNIIDCIDFIYIKSIIPYFLFLRPSGIFFHKSAILIKSIIKIDENFYLISDQKLIKARILKNSRILENSRILKVIKNEILEFEESNNDISNDIKSVSNDIKSVSNDIKSVSNDIIDHNTDINHNINNGIDNAIDNTDINHITDNNINITDNNLKIYLFQIYNHIKIPKHILYTKDCIIITSYKKTPFHFVPFVPVVHKAENTNNKIDKVTESLFDGIYNPNPTPLGTTVISCISIFSHKFQFIHKISLNQCEIITDIKLVLDRYFIVSTSFPESEDKIVKGRILLFSISPVVAFLEYPYKNVKAKFICSEIFKNCVTSISVIYKSVNNKNVNNNVINANNMNSNNTNLEDILIAVCISTKLLIYEVSYNGFTAVGRNEVGIFSSSINVTRNLIAISDIHNGIGFYFLRPENPLKITLLSKSCTINDLRCMSSMVICENINDNNNINNNINNINNINFYNHLLDLVFVTVTRSGSVKLFTYSPEEDRTNLIKRCEFSTGINGIGKAISKLNSTVIVLNNSIIEINLINLNEHNFDNKHNNFDHNNLLDRFIDSICEVHKGSCGIPLANYLVSTGPVSSNCLSVIPKRILLEYFYFGIKDQIKVEKKLNMSRDEIFEILNKI